MSEKSDSPLVRVLFDFEYTTDDGKIVRLKRGEQLVVITKTNDDWWQCKRVDHSKHINNNNNNCSSDGSLNDNCSEVQLFYAPVNHLKEIVHNININNNNNTNNNSFKRKNISTIKVGLCFTNPLSDSLTNDNNSEDDHLNGTSSRESLIDDNADCDNCGAMCSSHSSPIYANLQLTNSSSPPVPNFGVSPIRILLNHWAEYKDSAGRKYYYNSLSRESSWKPPRRKVCHSRDDEMTTSHSEENLTDSSSNSLSTTPNTSGISNSPTISPKSVPESKSRWRKFIRKSNKMTDSATTNQTSLPTLPKGWTRKLNDETREIYFVNEKTNEKWFCKLDENGRLYFFEENGQESYWELPDVNVNDDSSDDPPKIPLSSDVCSNDKSKTESQSPNNTIKTKKVSKLSTERSLFERNIKARSMAFLPTNSSLASRPIIPAILLQEDNHDLKEEPSLSVFQPPPICLDNSIKTIKEGVLHRTKLIEAGKRIRKNWCSCYLALTDYYLLFFKDAKSAQSGGRPEFTIELTGAIITWCPEKSRRKNCFQVSTITGHQVLLQEECALLCKEWFDLIKSAIFKLPTSLNFEELDKDSDKQGFKLKRSKSTKQYRKREDLCDNELSMSGFVPLMTSQSATNIPSERRKKIKERLRQFLRRRPTLESLREKGIFKDEPVFGGKLDYLCLRDKQSVPKFVQQCIQAIEAKDLKADGLYRACGNLSQVQKLRFQINQDNFSGIWSEDDVHVLTGLLKMFFRDMKEPLFPCDRFETLMKIIVLPDRKTKLDLLTNLVKELPRPNFDTLKYVLQHLLRVKEHSDENRMHIQNLAIVFGPTLMWPENDSNNFALDMMLRMHQNQIIEFLLLEFDNIFN